MSEKRTWLSPPNDLSFQGFIKLKTFFNLVEALLDSSFGRDQRHNPEMSYRHRAKRGHRRDSASGNLIPPTSQTHESIGRSHARHTTCRERGGLVN
ncbi:hypothetical protein WB44_13590 [Synechococcus sp. WH 8020]|nr:hypothetical protein WB44_13590 [Synechococcus sp. WH 8020]